MGGGASSKKGKRYAPQTDAVVIRHKSGDLGASTPSSRDVSSLAPPRPPPRGAVKSKHVDYDLRGKKVERSCPRLHAAVHKAHGTPKASPKASPKAAADQPPKSPRHWHAKNPACEAVSSWLCHDAAPPRHSPRHHARQSSPSVTSTSESEPEPTPKAKGPPTPGFKVTINDGLYSKREERDQWLQSHGAGVLSEPVVVTANTSRPRSGLVPVSTQQAASLPTRASARPCDRCHEMRICSKYGGGEEICQACRMRLH